MPVWPQRRRPGAPARGSGACWAQGPLRETASNFLPLALTFSASIPTTCKSLPFIHAPAPGPGTGEA